MWLKLEGEKMESCIYQLINQILSYRIYKLQIHDAVV